MFHADLSQTPRPCHTMHAPLNSPQRTHCPSRGRLGFCPEGWLCPLPHSSQMDSEAHKQTAPGSVPSSLFRPTCPTPTFKLNTCFSKTLMGKSHFYLRCVCVCVCLFAYVKEPGWFDFFWFVFAFSNYHLGTKKQTPSHPTRSKHIIAKLALSSDVAVRV